MLLMEGIGDTIRISLAADPVEEVKVGFDILKSVAFAPAASTSSPALLLASELRCDQAR
jgi:4-hydroxy-3-methylbut-2-en-1-yl diphosphate synthase IspG/GcpE